MADDDHDDHDHHVHGFMADVPGEIIGQMLGRRDRQRMLALEARNRKFEFLDSLDVPQLRALAFILGGDDPRQVFAYNHQVMGEIDTLLRIVHGVDPDEETPTADDTADMP